MGWWFSILLIYRSSLPRWLPFLNGCLLFLILLQGALGALTVIDLLPSSVIMMHFLIALSLVALMSGLSQRLLSADGMSTPFWWKFLSGVSLITVVGQSLIGSRMATTWSAQRCISEGIGCQLLFFHKASAFTVVACVFSFVITAVCMGGWFRAQWPLLLSVISLLIMQIILGVASLNLDLMDPFTRISHQLLASLLVALLSALSCRRPISLDSLSISSKEDTSFEVCHG